MQQRMPLLRHCLNDTTSMLPKIQTRNSVFICKGQHLDGYRLPLSNVISFLSLFFLRFPQLEELKEVLEHLQHKKVSVWEKKFNQVPKVGTLIWQRLMWPGTGRYSSEQNPAGSDRSSPMTAFCTAANQIALGSSPAIVLPHVLLSAAQAFQDRLPLHLEAQFNLLMFIFHALLQSSSNATVVITPIPSPKPSLKVSTS